MIRMNEGSGSDAQVVLAELEQAIAERREPAAVDARQVPTEVLIGHIVSRHHTPLREALPSLVPLAKKVARVHGTLHPNLLDVRDFVEELADALTPHLDHEEQVLFPALLTPGKEEVVAAELTSIQADHQEVTRLLVQLREATHDFDLPEGACNSYTTLFRELKATELGLQQLFHLEKNVLLPRFARA